MTTSIFADPSLANQCFPECDSLNYGKVFGKLAEKCCPLMKRLENGERIQEIESVQMSATNGFTSRVFRCKVTLCHLENGNGPHNSASPFSLILKVFSMDRANTLMVNFLGEEKMEELMKEMAKIKMEKAEKESGKNGDEKANDEEHPLFDNSFFTQMHRNECAFYEFINEFFPDGNNLPVPIPKIYFTQLGQAGGETDEQGLIAMEDLQDACMADFADGLNEEQVLLLTRTLANLHANLMAPNIGGNWQSLFKTYDKLFSNGDTNNKEETNKWMEAMREQMKDERILVAMHRLGPMLKDMDFFIWAEKKVKEEFGIAEMLVHGDLWINNILWQNKDQNQLAALIDWQLTMRGNPMTDIARLTSMSTEPELRHKMEKENQILVHYLKTLNTKLAEMGMKPVKYGVEELEKAYNMAMVSQAIACIFIIPFFQRVWAEMPDRDQRIARISRRAVVAIGDILEKMEKLAPEWLLPAPKNIPMEEVKINGQK